MKIKLDTWHFQINSIKINNYSKKQTTKFFFLIDLDLVTVSTLSLVISL